MKQYRTKLATKLDDLASNNKCQIIEQHDRITVSGLSAEDADDVICKIDALSWHLTAEDGDSLIERPFETDADFGPYKLMAIKADAVDDVAHVLTRSGFSLMLASNQQFKTMKLEGLETPFDTYATRFTNWGDDSNDFIAEQFTANPCAFSRDLSGQRLVPEDISMWVVKPDQRIPIDNLMTKIWVGRATSNLLNCLASEVEADTTILFKGNPSTKVKNVVSSVNPHSEDDFHELQNLARWVFKNPLETETKHALANAELARGKLKYDEPAQFLAENVSPAVQGARTAFQMGLSKISLEAIKALGDLRKSVSDETAKLSDTSRQLATAVTGSLFTGIGILAAKLSIANKSDAFGTITACIGIVLFLYILSVTFSGWKYLSIQRRMRVAWRNRLYRHITDQDYEALVNTPSNEAEKAFKNISFASVFVGFLMLTAILVLSWQNLHATTFDPVGEWWSNFHFSSADEGDKNALGTSTDQINRPQTKAITAR